MTTMRPLALVFVSALCALAEEHPVPKMAAKSWLKVPGTEMAPVLASMDKYPNARAIGGPGMVILAWGGGALDTKRNRMVLWGGGHADYYGNELYAFDITTLKWERLTEPFADPVKDVEVNSDGSPNSRHTYGGLAYIAHADRFFGQAGSLAGVGFAACDKTWVFDFDAKKWTDRKPASTPGGGFGICCAYDPIGKKLWWGAGDNGLWSYDYDQNAWAKLNGDNAFYECTATIDTKRHQLVFAGPGAVYSYDLEKPGSPQRSVWKTTGGEQALAGKTGFDYDPVADKLVAWRGGAVGVLDPETKAWTMVDAADAPAATANGMYGRWRYVPSVNAFVAITDPGAPVSFFKLTTGPGKIDKKSGSVDKAKPAANQKKTTP